MHQLDVVKLFHLHSDVAELAAGETIFEQDTPGDVMYVVLDGTVELSIDGKAFETAGPGDIVGEMALIDVPVRSATAVARTVCRLAVVDEPRFLFMVREHPYFALHVMSVLAERVRRTDRIAYS